MSRPQLHNYGSRYQRPRKRGWGGSMRLGALFLVLVGINVYVFFFRSGTSIRDVLKTGAIAGATLADKAGKRALASATPVTDPADDAIVLRGTMQKHNGLFAALAAHGLKPGQTAAVVKALQGKLNMRSLRPEHSFEIRLDPGTRDLRRFSYKVSPVLTVEARRRSDGSLVGRRVQAKLDTRTVRFGGRISSSLNRAMTKRGEAPAMVALFTHLFSWDINWYTDPRKGDEFRIVVEKQYKGGKFYRYGRILAAEYNGRAGRFQVYHFEHDGKSGHYTPEGRSVRRRFLKTPLTYRRISSKYNRKRFHPVLHRTKGHFGVDYAAARGTPVYAAADGKVVSARRAGGAGNMVVLRHGGHITTLYMHLHRFARGLKPGKAIKQRQLVGTVGSTGLATGPHLHYGIKVRGRNVDPLRFSVGKGPLLPRGARERFLEELPDRMADLESILTK